MHPYDQGVISTLGVDVQMQLRGFHRPRSQAHLLLLGGCPELAALFQVLTLLQLLLPEVAAHHRVAVLVLNPARTAGMPANQRSGNCPVRT